MPGHTYSALHRYADAAWQQEASARVDHAHMIRYAVMPDEIHNYSHNNGWLVEDLAYIGRVHEAIALAQNLIELPRIPRGKAGVNTANQEWNKDGSSWAEGRRRLAWVLLNLREVVRCPAPRSDTLPRTNRRFRRGPAAASPLRPGPFRERRCSRRPAHAGGALRTGTRPAKTTRRRHGRRREEESRSRNRTPTSPRPGKTPPEISRGKIDQLREKLAELSLVQKLTSNDIEAAKTALADVKGMPDERLSRYFGRVQDWTKALELAKKASDDATGQVAPLANYLAILRGSILAGRGEGRAEQTTELNDGFQKLRSFAAHADLDLASSSAWAISRRATGASPPNPPRTWARVRRSITSAPPIGPAVAPTWSVTAAKATPATRNRSPESPISWFSTSEKPAPIAWNNSMHSPPRPGNSRPPALPILAVGTDTVEGLAATMTKEGNPFPFRLVSDHRSSPFKSFRAYDDFESQPLHSTVFVDAAGRIRWQHISFNPFMKPDFLLDEVKRLMKLPAQPAAVARK